MTDDTLRALLAYFPLMLLLCSVEAAALRGDRKTRFEKGAALFGLLTTTLGLMGVLFELMVRERGIVLDNPDAVDTTVFIWALAFLSTVAGIMIAISRLAQWSESQDR